MGRKRFRKIKVTGVFEENPSGYGFVSTDAGEIYISDFKRCGAVDGQKVEVLVDETELLCSYAAHRAEGTVIRVLSPYPQIIGTFRRYSDSNILVEPDDRVSYYISVRPSETRNAKDGDRVVAVIDRPDIYSLDHEGRVLEVLGNEEDPGIEIIVTARKFGLKEYFPKETEKYARGLKFLPDSEERLDLRNETIFTIDGDDAKDLDDAVSVKLLDNGNWQLGVHIADVSHYVRQGDPVDREAYKRGTSVYLINRVIPMLPKTLSNDLCSLNAGEDKLTLSCIMEVGRDGNVVASDICKTVICSKGRLTYRKVNMLLEGETVSEYENLKDDINMLYNLACAVREKRHENGSIDFDIDEADIILDENSCPVSVEVSPRGKGEKLIEDCMLLANMTVAETYRNMGCPFVYRVHEQPDGDDMHALAVFLSGFGIPLKGYRNIHPKALQTVLESVKGRKEAAIINRVALRSLKKARYDVIPKGHFGLSAEDYCHFTSPIRRYPDLMVHRIISDVIAGKLDEDYVSGIEEILSDAAEHSSECERNAIDAERKVRDMKMAEYMYDRAGEIFSGVVSGVTDFGIFVELENTIEGLVRYSHIDDDYYEVDREHYLARGEVTGRIIRLGDSVHVMCVGADPEAGRVSFVFVK